MSRFIAILTNWTVHALRAATGLSFVVLMAAVLIQVFGRSVIGTSPVWTEELARFALLYLTGFGAGLAILSGDLVNVDLIAESLPDPMPFVLRLLAACTTFAFAAILIGPAWRYVSIGVRQTSAALGMRMDYIHFSIMALLLSLALFAALRVIGMIFGTTDGLPESRPEHDT
ncbi:TRAP transporter small permease [Roseinatronobacter alkalisoli]|uniref:TRAP transporter small permease protein n=1 Tax=Roseinatronobacter alkalisoli TaxID=3028235 RepID=A0ABT5TE01_9RHOB|nr:TRAP transporter small permease subunit [Roseinatronobacter sp. HJB301]MDD7973347.1 TRAP transporter small permease subunit [Roseinatronobacter sp. HJB301]